MKTASFLFIITFLTAISLPLVFMDHKSVVSEKENRTLAAYPKIIESGSIMPINTLLRSLDSYINDRFGFRNLAVSFINKINKNVKIINGNVVLGKENWLFYSKQEDGDNISDFLKTNLFSNTELKHVIQNIEDRFVWCNENGIRFFLLIAPNKHNIYPEYYPIDRPEGITRADQIINALPANLKNIVIYPLNELMQSKNSNYPLYYEIDTHWNANGAKCAFDAMFMEIKNTFPHVVFPEIIFTTEISYSSFGDIVPMSGFASYGKNTIPNIHPVEGWDAYYSRIKNEGVQGVITMHANKTLPKAIIFRDSFFTALEPFISSIFGEAEYNWRWFNSTEKEYILKNKPDIIIWEIVERSMAGLSNSAW
jgi:hypothetical protein